MVETAKTTKHSKEITLRFSIITMYTTVLIFREFLKLGPHS